MIQNPICSRGYRLAGYGISFLTYGYWIDESMIVPTGPVEVLRLRSQITPEISTVSYTDSVKRFLTPVWK